MIDRSIIDEVRHRVDIAEVVGEEVALTRKGRDYLGLCPFHDDKRPSFRVVPHISIYKCFSCAEGGDVFKFVQKTRGMGFEEAVRYLAERVGVRVPEREVSPEERDRIRARRNLYDVCELACEQFHGMLMTSSQGAVARDYLAGRGITEETIRTWKLGYVPDDWTWLMDRLRDKDVQPRQLVAAGLAKWRSAEDPGRGAYDMFRGRLMGPICDGRGRITAFWGRTFQEGVAKYINSPETEIYEKSKTLFGLDRARAAIQRRQRALVVEGYFDVMALHQAGFEEAVAACGTALTTDQVRELGRHVGGGSVVALFDSDEAGLRAADRSMMILLDHGLEPLSLDLGEAKDPDEFIQTQGPEAFEERLSQSVPLFDRYLSRVSTRQGATPFGVQRTVEEVAPALRRFPAAAQASVVRQVARVLHIPEEVVRKAVGNVRPSDRATGPSAPFLPESAPRVQRWVGSRELVHLCWLLIRHPEPARRAVFEYEDSEGRVGPPEPSVCTERQSAQVALAWLLEGKGLAGFLDDLEDPDLHHFLTSVGARDGLYTPEVVPRATRDILRKLEENHVVRLLRELDGVELSGATGRENLVRRQALQRRLKELKERRTGRFRGPSRSDGKA